MERYHLVPVDYDPFAPQAGNVGPAPSQISQSPLVQSLVQNPQMLRALLQRLNGVR